MHIFGFMVLEISFISLKSVLNFLNQFLARGNKIENNTENKKICMSSGEDG